MGELFRRYFELLAGRSPGAEYGVIATPADEAGEVISAGAAFDRGCLCPAC